MARTISLLLVLLALSAIAVAQKSTAEVAFEKNKAKYTREHFEMGEDASSGYDYLFYKQGDKIVMIRSIGSASYKNEIRIDDLYFDGGLTFMRRSTSTKRNLSALIRGRNVVLASKEEFHFANGKMIRWVENGKTIDTSDKRWAETEKSILDNATAEVENYKFLKEENR